MRAFPKSNLDAGPPPPHLHIYKMALAGSEPWEFNIGIRHFTDAPNWRSSKFANYMAPRAGGEGPLFYRAPLGGGTRPGVTRLSIAPGLDLVFQRSAFGVGFGRLAVAVVSFLPIRYKSVNWTKRPPPPSKIHSKTPH